MVQGQASGSHNGPSVARLPSICLVSKRRDCWLAQIRDGVEGAHSLVGANSCNRRRRRRGAPTAPIASQHPFAARAPVLVFRILFLRRRRGILRRIYKQDCSTSMTAENQARNTPDGGSWAAVLAAAIGCAAIGVLTDLSEASKSISSALSFSKQVGDLSGKTSLGIFCWLIAWAFLHFRWRRRDLVAPARVAALSIVLIFVSLIAVFPPFFKRLIACGTFSTARFENPTNRPRHRLGLDACLSNAAWRSFPATNAPMAERRSPASDWASHHSDRLPAGGDPALRLT